MNIQDLGVSEELSEALKKQQIEKAFPVQEQVIPKMLAGENVAAIAPTGTGKTLAYLLPALMQIDAADQSPQAVVLAPTYELAMQIARTAQELTQAAGLPIRTAGLVGGANTARQIERLKKKKPQLITGSAGRLIELAQKGKLRLHDVSLLVLDEFDRLFDAQNMEHTAAFVQMLRKARGERPISYALFSATASRRALEQADFLGHPALICVEAAPEDLAHVEHYAMVVPFRDKIQKVRKLTRRLGVKRGLVFTNRVYDAYKMLEHLRYDGLRVTVLTGRENKQLRRKAVADLEKGAATLLLATDLAARGLDIRDVDTVFNLDLPEDARTYLHRAGRTGRAGKEGRVVTLADPKEAGKLTRLQKALSLSFQPLKRESGR